MLMALRADFQSIFRPEITLGEIIGIIISLAGTLILVGMRLRRWYISQWPFRMDAFLDNADQIEPEQTSVKILSINGINNLFPLFMTLRIQPKIGATFEQINIRFMEKRWRIFNDWKEYWRFKKQVKWDNAPKNIVSITNVTDQQVKQDVHHSGRDFRPVDDNRGGYDGWYVPAYFCPKSGMIWLEIRMSIHVERQWQGYISFQHRLGDAQRGYVRKKVIIKNQLIADKK